MRSLAILCACLLGVAGLSSADRLPDPWRDCRPDQSIAALIALRAPLDARPDDQDLLGRAIMAYVNLSLGGEPGLDGSCGPWLTHARDLAGRRARARGGEPVSLADAAPELWVRVLDGDAVGVVAALERWDGQRDDPLHRALSARATRDVRPFRTAPPRTPHEAYARMFAACGAEIHEWDAEFGEVPMDPLIIAYQRWWADDDHAHLADVIRSAYADVVRMLDSTEVDEATAVASLHRLIAGCGGDAPVDATRAALATQAQAFISRLHHPCRHPAALAAAVKATEVCLKSPRGLIARGVMDGSRHRMIGLGDVAAWNRDRLYLAGWLHGYLVFSDPKMSHRDLSTALRLLLPGSVIAARVMASHYASAPGSDPTTDLGAALARELDDPDGISPGLLSKPFYHFATWDPKPAALLTSALLAARERRSIRPGDCLNELARGCWMAGNLPRVAAQVHAAAARDPWNVELMTHARRTDPERRLLSDPPPADARLVHPQINFKNPPFAGIVASGKGFAVRWQGFLRIDRAGRWRIGVGSDDRSLLRVGGVSIAIDANRQKRVRSAELDLQPGWVAFDLDYLQTDPGGVCGLMWQPPGAAKLVPVPATALAHGDGRIPGVAAEVFTPARGAHVLLAPSARELAAAEAMPWLPRVHGDLGRRLFHSERPEAAVAAFDLALTMGPLRPDEWSSFIPALLNQSHPDRTKAMREIWRHPSDADFDEIQYVIYQVRRLALQEAALAAAPGRTGTDVVSGQLRGRLAFDTGDFIQAKAAWSRVLEHPDFDPDGDPYHLILLDHAVIDRIGAPSSPDLQALLKTYRRTKARSCYLLSARWLAGEISWDDAVAEAATVKWGDVLWYARGLYRLTIGEHEGAKADLSRIVTDHPDWNERWTCEALLRWYARQTPESLAARPRAPAIVAREPTLPPVSRPSPASPGPPTVPRPTGDDF